MTFGTLGKDLANLLLLSSLFACVLSFHTVVAPYQYVLACKGLLPAALGRVHGAAARRFVAGPGCACSPGCRRRQPSRDEVDP